MSQKPSKKSAARPLLTPEQRQAWALLDANIHPGRIAAITSREDWAILHQAFETLRPLFADPEPTPQNPPPSPPDA